MRVRAPPRPGVQGPDAERYGAGADDERVTAR